MPLLAAQVARSGEWALNTWVRAVRLVVPDLATVEALSGQAAAALTPLLWAVTREVTIGTAARKSCQ